MFPEDLNVIVDYVNNVDVLYSQKRCEIYMSQAITIMKKDLDNYQDCREAALSDEFPFSLVSNSAVELLKLGECILEEIISKHY